MSAQDRGNWSQAFQRRGQMFTDQHGRQYHASIEIKTGDTTGLIGALYQCPLPVPLMYLGRSEDRNRPYDLVINYKQWRKDIRDTLDAWKKQSIAAAVRRYGDEFDTSKPMPADILELFPRPPVHEEAVIAAQQGNSWVLGKTTVVDKRLEKFFDVAVIDPEYHSRNEPDFRDIVDASEAAMDLEDEVDPDATGGKRVKVGKVGRPRKVAEMADAE